MKWEAFTSLEAVIEERYHFIIIIDIVQSVCLIQGV